LHAARSQALRERIERAVVVGVAEGIGARLLEDAVEAVFGQIARVITGRTREFDAFVEGVGAILKPNK